MFIVFAIAVLSVLFGTGYYLAHQFYHGLVSFIPKLRFWPFIVFFAILVLIMVLSFGRSMMPLSSGIKHFLGVVGAYVMGVYIYLLLFTIIADIITLVPVLLHLSFTTHRFFKGIVMLSVLSLSIVTCIYGFVNARSIDHVTYEVKISEKADISDIKLVLISDLHLGSVGSEGRLEEIVDEINSLEPDVVCIAGDFFDSDYSAIKNPDAALKTLQEISSTYGTYACLGNHDAGQTASQMTDFLDRAGIILLSEEYTVIDDRFVIVGRLDSSPIGGFNGVSRKDFTDFYTLNKPELPVIVLDHNPANIDAYGKEADLILCGHTHKGQLFPANLITDSMYTVDYGYYRENDQSPHVIVTSGIGYWGMPMRVGTDSEIVTVTFADK